MKSPSQDRTGVICENVVLISIVNLKGNTFHGDLFRKLAILCKKVSIASVCEFSEWRGLSEIYEKYKCICERQTYNLQILTGCTEGELHVLPNGD